MNKKIMVISSVHRWDDTRIYHRQCNSLSKKYTVELHAQADFKSRVFGDIRVVGLPKPKKKYFRIILLIILLYRILKSNATLIHFHDPELLIVGYISKMFLKKMVIYDVHEHIIFDIAQKEWIPQKIRNIVTAIVVFIEKICVPKFDAVIYTTSQVGERYRRLSKSAISIENYSKINTFAKLQKANNLPNVIFLGRVLPVRGVDNVIRAFEFVKQRFNDAKFVIVGDIVPIEFERKLKHLAKSLGLQNNVIFAGFIPHLSTLKYLSDASCGIVTFLPNKENMACLPNKLFEYMATGLPIVASNFDQYVEIVDGNKCGVTVDPQNVKQIAEAIIGILENKKDAEVMSKNGKNAFLKKYNWENEEIRLLNLYQAVMR